MEIKRIAKIRDGGDVMIYAKAGTTEAFMGLVGPLESIEIIGDWYLRLPDGRTLWADVIQRAD